MREILCILIGYPFGCFLTASVVAKYHASKAVGQMGTGNPGAANMAGQLGLKWGIVTLLGDMVKTLIPCLLCGYILFASTPGAILYAGLGAICGHMWPVWKKFRGGLGVACVAAVILLFSPLWGIVALVAGLLLLLLTGYTDIAAVAIPVAFMVPMLFRGFAIALPSMLITTAILLRHMGTLIAIFNGQVPKTDIIQKLKQKFQ